jgi:ribosome recycling factor
VALDLIANLGLPSNSYGMSFAEIKEKVPTLTLEERRELAAILKKSPFEEIKEKVRSLSEEERLDLAHLLLHLQLENDPEHIAELQRRMDAMDRGEKYTLADVERICKERDARAA